MSDLCDVIQVALGVTDNSMHAEDEYLKLLRSTFSFQTSTYEDTSAENGVRAAVLDTIKQIWKSHHSAQSNTILHCLESMAKTWA